MSNRSRQSPRRQSLHTHSSATSSNPRPSSSSSYLSHIRDSHAEQPLSEAEQSIRDHARRSLRRAYRQITTTTVSDWMFSAHDQPFHLASNLPQPSFSDSIGLQDRRSGRNLLLVPVTIRNNRLLGYSFGPQRSIPSSFSSVQSDSLFFAHNVARFSYSLSSNELLIIAHNQREISVSTIRRAHNTNSSYSSGRRYQHQRERQTIVLRADAESNRALLEDDILRIMESTEGRVGNPTGYQFVRNRDNQSNVGNDQLRAGMAVMEQLVRGYYTGDRMREDTMDEHNGRLISRMTSTISIEFSLLDAVQMRVRRDMAIRTYFSYVSSYSSRSSSQSTPHGGGSNVTSRSGGMMLR